MITYTPEFSPRSRYRLRDWEEASYFTQHGGAPEAGLITWARSLAKPDEVFIDVGAHVGSWAQDLAQHCKVVVAFEPQASTYERLVAGIEETDIKNILCVQAALGSRATMVNLSHVSVDGGGSTIHHRSELGPVLETEVVRVMTLDKMTLDGARIGLIKLDVEGAETDVLGGALETIHKHRPQILAEAWLHSWYLHERSALHTVLQLLGYEVSAAPGWPEMLWAVPR